MTEIAFIVSSQNLFALLCFWFQNVNILEIQTWNRIQLNIIAFTQPIPKTIDSNIIFIFFFSLLYGSKEMYNWYF